MNNMGFDWNGNGRRDSFDSFVDMKLTNSCNNSNNLSNQNQNNFSNNSSNNETSFKPFIIITLCVLGVILPIIFEFGKTATCICLLIAVALSIIVIRKC